MKHVAKSTAGEEKNVETSYLWLLGGVPKRGHKILLIQWFDTIDKCCLKRDRFSVVVTGSFGCMCWFPLLANQKSSKCPIMVNLQKPEGHRDILWMAILWIQLKFTQGLYSFGLLEVYDLFKFSITKHSHFTVWKCIVLIFTEWKAVFWFLFNFFLIVHLHPFFIP